MTTIAKTTPSGNTITIDVTALTVTTPQQGVLAISSLGWTDQYTILVTPAGKVGFARDKDTESLIADALQADLDRKTAEFAQSPKNQWERYDAKLAAVIYSGSSIAPHMPSCPRP